jgi:hypothetical protein
LGEGPTVATGVDSGDGEASGGQLSNFEVHYQLPVQGKRSGVVKIVFLYFGDTENSFTMINFIASFLVIIEYGVGIDSKFFNVKCDVI